MKSSNRFIARLLRRLDRRRNIRLNITQAQWELYLMNQDYRERRYWQINRGNG